MALVGALIVRNGMLLLGRRSARKAVCPDMWDVIGGHVEAGETFEDALLREVDEETGIRPLVYEEHSRHPLPQGGVLVLFQVTGWAGSEPRLRNDEHVELRWFPVRAACTLPNLAAPEYVSVFRSLAQPAFRRSGQARACAGEEPARFGRSQGRNHAGGGGRSQ